MNNHAKKRTNKLNKLIEKTSELEISIYFYEYKSLLNNMVGGEFNIFLNKNQTEEKIYEDLKSLLSEYAGMQKVKK